MLLGMFVLGIATTAYASTPYQYLFQVNPDVGSVYTQNIDAPSDNDDCYLFGIDASTHTPRMISANAGLSCGLGSALNISAVPITQIDGLSEIIAELRGDFATDTANIAGATSTLATLSPQMATSTAFITEVRNNLSGASTTMMVSSGAPGLMYATDKVKIDALSTTTQADWTQTVATSSSFIKNKPILGIAYEGTTQRTNAFPIFKSATVASGVAVFNLTTDGTSGGTALFPNGVIQDSVNAFVSDATASYQMSYAFSNSNKTLTVTTNKLSTTNILTGVLGQVAGNGSVVKLSVWGY